jgi:Flp pilus assembly protein TadD
VAWHLDRVIAERPDDWTAHARRRQARLALGDQTGAAEDEAEIVRLGSDDQAKLWERHRVIDALQSGRWTQAITMLDRLVAAFPHEVALYIDRATAHDRLGQHQQSRADIAMAIEKGADDPSLLYPFGVDSARDGRWDQAAAVFSRVRRTTTVSLQAWVTMALTTLKASDSRAYPALCRTLWDHSNSLRAEAMNLNNIAWCCAVGPGALDDYRPVIDGLEAAVAQTPASPGARRHVFLNTLGAVLYRAGKFAVAIDRLEQGMTGDPTASLAQDHVFLAMAHQRLGHRAEAERWLAKVPKSSAPGSAGSFWDAVEIGLLRGEAEAVIFYDPIFPANPFQ